MKINYKIAAQNILNAINESGDCIYKLTMYKNIYNVIVLDFNYANMYHSFDTYKELYFYLKGFKKGANCLKPF